MKKIFSIALVSLALSSCVDTVILPENKTLDEDFWQKKSDVESIVAAAYSQLRDGGTAAANTSFQRNIIVWSDFRSDEMVVASDFKSVNAVTTGLSEIHSMNLTPTNLFTQWYPLYSCINYCNLVLEKGENVMKIDPSYTEGDWLANKAQVTALKALCYFYLVRVFRDVPVTPHVYLNSSDDLLVPQTAPAQVLQMCIDDLEDVVIGAPNNNAFNDSRDRGLFNKDGINSLLADIYLWRASVNHSAEDYKKCVEYCDKVIAAKKASHTFRPYDKDKTEKDYYLAEYSDYYDDVWGMNGQNAEESILEIQYKENGIANTALSNMYYGYSSYTSGYGYVKTTNIYGDYSASGSTANIFKNTVDQRAFDFCFGANSGTEQYAIRKFVAERKAPDAKADAFSTERRSFSQNWIIYRLTDIMLMKAEALVQLAQPAESGEAADMEVLQQAFELVKAVNDRALTNTSSSLKFSTYQDRMEQLVLMERARELCFEGKRWFDLLRYNYRHVEGTEYDKLMSEITTFPAVSAEFYEVALSKYTAVSAMKAKMPTEPYLYMPLNEEEVKINTALVQNPAFNTKNK